MISVKNPPCYILKPFFEIEMKVMKRKIKKTLHSKKLNDSGVTIQTPESIEFLEIHYTKKIVIVEKNVPIKNLWVHDIKLTVNNKDIVQHTQTIWAPSL